MTRYKADSTTGAASLEDLAALNEEIAALVRAGLPLERGLKDLGRDLPGRLGHFAELLGERISRGETLAAAIAAERGSFPPLYAAVVEAGARSGRLAAALEGMGGAARRLAELRSAAGVAVLYPAMVLLAAYLFFVLLVVQFLPQTAPIYADFNVPAAEFLARLSDWRATAWYWGPAVPILAGVVLLAWWLQSGRAWLLESRTAGRLLGWIPGVGKLLMWSQAAAMSEMLALMIEHQVPLTEALPLAGAASGRASLHQATQRLATALEQGANPPAPGDIAGVPPLFTWLMAAGYERGKLAAALHRSAEVYRQRAIDRSEAARVFLPVCFSLVIGGTATLAYALLTFVPWISLLKAVSAP